jgi:hypothetical protein
LVSRVTVTDRHHALCGQLLPLVSLHSARGPAYIVVALPDGRGRSLRRASSDLAGTAEASLYDGPRISVGTLLRRMEPREGPVRQTSGAEHRDRR